MRHLEIPSRVKELINKHLPSSAVDDLIASVGEIPGLTSASSRVLGATIKQKV